MLWRRISGLMPVHAGLCEEEGGGGGGGGDRKPDVTAQVEGLKARYGSAQAALAVLYEENHGLREDRRKLREQLEQSKPAAGSVVLTADEAKTWEAYKALGKPEEIQGGLKERDDLKGTVARHERNERIVEAAAASGYSAKALQDMPGVADLTFEVKDETVDGQAAKVAYVTEKKDGATPRKLADHAKEHWSHLMGALEATDGDEEGRPKGDSRDTTFPRQKPDGKPPRKGPPTEEEFRRATRETADYSL